MSNFEENREPDISSSEVMYSLIPFFHDIEKSDITFLYHGTYNVFEVKKKYIFRFPDRVLRNSKGVDLILHELKMLNIIRHYLSFLIPDPIFVSIEKDNPFMGYEKIEGVSLSECFDTISNHQKIEIAEQIAFFLSQLHSTELFKIIQKETKNEFSPEKYKSQWYKFYLKSQDIIFPLMNSTQKHWIDTKFNTFLNSENNFHFQPTVVHGDFDTSNILVNPDTFEVTGIIDFEETRIYDPAADFLFYEEGDLFLNHLLKNYDGIIDLNFKERMKFLYGCNCLFYMEFGIEHNLPEIVKAGLELLDFRMKTFKL